MCGALKQMGHKTGMVVQTCYLTKFEVPGWQRCIVRTCHETALSYLEVGKCSHERELRINFFNEGLR